MNSEKWQGLVFVPVIASLLVLAGCMGAPPSVPGVNPVIIRQSGGAGAILAEGQDKDYLIRTADYIVEGTVTGVESRWNEERTGIFTYTGLTASTYIKGAPLPVSAFQIVTLGGTVGDITQVVEDQPIFHAGKKVRLYLKKANGDFSVVCGRFGVEDLELQPVSSPR